MQEINKEAIQSGSLFADVMDNVNGNFENIETNFTMVENMISDHITNVNNTIQAGGFVCGICSGSLPSPRVNDTVYEHKIDLGFKPKFVILFPRTAHKVAVPVYFIASDEFDTSTLYPILTDNGFTLFYCNKIKGAYPDMNLAIWDYIYIASRYEGAKFYSAELTERDMTSEV